MELLKARSVTASGSAVALGGTNSVEVEGLKVNAPTMGEGDALAGLAGNVFTRSSRAGSTTEVGEWAERSGAGNDAMNFRAGGDSDLDGVGIDRLGDTRGCCSKAALSRAIEDFGLGASGGILRGDAPEPISCTCAAWRVGSGVAGLSNMARKERMEAER